MQSLAPYLAVGAFVWLALLESGVHATLVGVALGLLTPAWPLRSPRRFPTDARRVLDDIERAYYDRVLTNAEFVETEQRIAEVARLAMYATSPLERLERALSPWVAYVIVPVFALANAGVELSGDALAGIASRPGDARRPARSARREDHRSVRSIASWPCGWVSAGCPRGPRGGRCSAWP